MRVVLTPVAAGDVDATLRDTLRLFGALQVDVYSNYFARAFEMLADDPFRASSVARDDIRTGARSLRLAVAAGKTQAASHVICYRIDRPGAASAIVVVMRVLHERMEIRPELLDEGAG